MLATVGKYVAPPAGALPPTRWGDPQVVAELLGDAVEDLRTWTTHRPPAVPQRRALRRLLPHQLRTDAQGREKLDEAERAAFRADLVALAEEFNLATDGTFVSEWEYLLVSARKR